MNKVLAALLLLLCVTMPAWAAKKSFLSYQKGMSVQQAEQKGASLIDGKLAERFLYCGGEWTLLADKDGSQLGMPLYLSQRVDHAVLDAVIDDLDLSGFMPVHVDRNGITQDLLQKYTAGASLKQCFQTMDAELEAFWKQGEGSILIIFVPLHVFKSLAGISGSLSGPDTLFAKEPVPVLQIDAKSMSCVLMDMQSMKKMGTAEQ